MDEAARRRRQLWDLTRGAFAYRTYDCVSAATGHRLDVHDVLLADGLNAQMRASDIAGVLAVADEVSSELARVDDDGTRFWDLAQNGVAEPPSRVSQRLAPLASMDDPHGRRRD